MGRSSSATRCKSWPRDNRTSRLTGVHYRSPLDFVVEHGGFYEPRLSPPQIEPGSPARCFANALLMAERYGWSYVEGWALSALGLYPVCHAWCLNALGQALEITWPQVGRAYLGVRFSNERAADALWYGDGSILQDSDRGHPLLQAPWVSDALITVWPDLPLLRFVREGDIEQAWAWVRGEMSDLHARFREGR